jgi:hypothetical protein
VLANAQTTHLKQQLHIAEQVRIAKGSGFAIIKLADFEQQNSFSWYNVDIKVLQFFKHFSASLSAASSALSSSFF